MHGLLLLVYYVDKKVPIASDKVVMHIPTKPYMSHVMYGVTFSRRQRGKAAGDKRE
jgi:hypothetical protein